MHISIFGETVILLESLSTNLLRPLLSELFFVKVLPVNVLVFYATFNSGNVFDLVLDFSKSEHHSDSDM